MALYFMPLKTYREAKRKAPWAAVIARHRHGFLAFVSRTDYRLWRLQK